MSKRRILHITARADFGGGPEHVFRLIEQLQDRCNIFIACPNDYPYFDKFTNLIGNEKSLQIPHRKFKIAALFELIKFIKKHKVEIVHSHGKGAGIYSRLLGLFSKVKVVHTFHGIHIEQYSLLMKNIYLLVEKFLSKFTTKFISVSESEKSKVIKNKIAPSAKIEMINNGVKIPNNQQAKICSKNLSLLFITRNDPQKNNSAALQILEFILQNEKFAKAELHLIGSKLESLVEQAEELGIKDSVIYHGEQKDLSEFFNSADFYLNTSLAEGLSLSILEAMAHGIPVIASKVTGNIDLIEEAQNGFLFELDTPEKGATAIISCSYDLNIYKQISINNINLIKQYFSVELMAEKTFKIYETV